MGGDLGQGTVEHGGSLAQADALFPGAPKPWVDLSTGINPHSYPLFSLPATALTRLPEPARAREVCRVAALAYGAPSGDTVVAAPGTQILLPRVMALRPPGRAVVLGPTYAEHARAAALVGHRVSETRDLQDLEAADVAVVVNPNNPDGRIVPRADLLGLGERLARRGGLLVVDEAFMDVGPCGVSLAGDVETAPVVVLRSFGKFFGLAGVRLGFALASRTITSQLDAELGPWAVAGPALEYGLRALADEGWREQTRDRLAAAADRLDALLSEAGFPPSGGTPLFRFLRHPDAPDLFQHLGNRGILVRRFAERPGKLRLGLLGADGEWDRLADALRTFRAPSAFSQDERGPRQQGEDQA